VSIGRDVFVLMAVEEFGVDMLILEFDLDGIPELIEVVGFESVLRRLLLVWVHKIILMIYM
jgi:hypothetical protein